MRMEEKRRRLSIAGASAGGSRVREGDGTPGSTPAAEPPDPNDDDDGARQKCHPLVNRLQKVFRAVQFITRLQRRNRPPENGDKGEESQTPSPGEEEEPAAATLKEQKETRHARFQLLCNHQFASSYFFSSDILKLKQAAVIITHNRCLPTASALQF
ncbi:hypothetical protein E2562_008746 [Oryza meyeriana var. granulata]|uniref:Uncharacterized protein n=1 Tax=Oryza meyeriana var. granulata TaxID=110450 RepID=A0A6G1F5S1_9ORYZ|nr:hypothetical protein E2562_008746 [Oryza meyeriana var. granulata]